MKPLSVETLVMLRILAITSLSVTALTLTALAAVPKLLKRPGVMLLLRSVGPMRREG